MLKSMTGFGRSELSDGQRKITVEIKSVNHRYLDVNIKMPKKLNFFEAAIRNFLKKKIQRGKVDIYITYDDLAGQTASLTFNRELAEEYVEYFQKMEHLFGIRNDMTASILAAQPEVLSMEEQPTDEEQIWTLLESVLREASQHLIEMRSMEGQHLEQDLSEKLEKMLLHVNYIKEQSPNVLKEYQRRLEEKVRQLLGSTFQDENRILTEVAIYADKICVDEEVVRLKSHILNMKDTIGNGTGVGRKLDFLTQEMNREANTILSKANDLDITNRAIELKTDIEKIREQIQNIE